MWCEVEIPAESVAVVWWKYLKILGVLSFSEGVKELAGRQGVSAEAFRDPHKHWAFLISRSGPAIWPFRILSSAFVCSLPFSGFASAMTLEMSLAAKGFPSFLVREFSERARY